MLLALDFGKAFHLGFFKEPFSSIWLLQVFRFFLYGLYHLAMLLAISLLQFLWFFLYGLYHLAMLLAIWLLQFLWFFLYGLYHLAMLLALEFGKAFHLGFFKEPFSSIWLLQLFWFFLYGLQPVILLALEFGQVLSLGILFNFTWASFYGLYHLVMFLALGFGQAFNFGFFKEQFLAQEFSSMRLRLVSVASITLRCTSLDFGLAVFGLGTAAKDFLVELPFSLNVTY